MDLDDMQVCNQFYGQAENNTSAIELFKLSKKANDLEKMKKSLNLKTEIGLPITSLKAKLYFVDWLFCSQFPTCILVIFYENMSKKG